MLSLCWVACHIEFYVCCTLGPPPPTPSEKAEYSLVSLSGLYILSNVAHADNTSVTYIVKLHTDETNTTSYFWVVSVCAYTVNRIDHAKSLGVSVSQPYSAVPMKCIIVLSQVN